MDASKNANNLGNAIFAEIDTDPYLNELYSNILYNYSRNLFGFKNGEKKSVNVGDALRYADILSKSTDIHKADFHKIWAQEIVALLQAVEPQHPVIDYYLGSVLLSAGNYRGMEMMAPAHKAETLLDRFYMEFSKDFMSIPAEPGNQFFRSQKAVYDRLNEPYFSYSGPTSMGKSFVMRMYIKQRIMEGATENFALLVPTKALINEVTSKIINDLKELLAEKNYRLVTSAGALALNQKHNFIFVLTPERLLYLLMGNPHIKIDYLFVDEAHKISSKDSRGAFYYKVVDMLSQRANKPHVIFASPNIPNPEIYLKLIPDAQIGPERVLATSFAPVSQVKYLIDFPSNVPCRYFIYDSKKLSDVRQFATSGNIEIMIINIDAFKKAENIINQAQDKLNGETAMRYIQDTNPIVIIDEPQSVDNTAKSKEAIASMNPLCVLRYSATHREKINLLYRLTPVDAYQMGLVKQICVSSNSITNDFNKPYILLKSVSNENGFRAKLEIDVQAKNGTVSRKTVTAKPGDDLYLLSARRELYDGYQLSGIDCTPGSECVEFANTEIVRLGKAIGAVDESILKRAQIRRTIEAHFDKELRYLEKGIKVLSLFFIDEVAKYRTSEGEKGIYAEMFEECYLELLERPKYAELERRFTAGVENAHNGYFSQDKKGVYKNTRGDTQADDDTYNTIMRDKEWLLSFECPLRFIFSHSALKEGWDNPNVFQVCTLIEQKSAFTCRQKIGRGLRLCVDQQGNRIEDRDTNILHVMANESFAEFADTLQREIEQETGVKFGVLQLSLFVGQIYTEEIVQQKNVDESEAEMLIGFMKNHGYVTDDGKPTELAKAAVVEQTAELPPQMEEIKEHVAKAIEQDTQ